MSGPPVLRGRVYRARVSDFGEEYYLVVSNNRRNAQLGHVLGVRLTVAPKPPMDSIVEIPADEPFAGRALCDQIERIYHDEITGDLGPMSPPTMRRIEQGLRAALTLA
jgi:mRNA interferase MazF